MKTGLVLEGGAMRGIYTAGVLDEFLDAHICADGVIGVSAGAIHGCSYVSGQRGRSIRYYMKYVKDWRFMSFRSFFLTGDLVNVQFCYHDLPKRLDVFDHEAFESSPVDFYVTCTNVETGKAEYVRLDEMRIKMPYLQASASMPLASRIVETDGKKLLDGGAADSVPLKAFQEMGYEKNIVVLTRPAGYRKKPSNMAPVRLVYRKYPRFVETMESRYLRYNETVDEIERQERDGKIVVVRPSIDLKMGRMEKHPKKVLEAYCLGRRNAREKLDEVKKFLEN